MRFGFGGQMQYMQACAVFICESDRPFCRLEASLFTSDQWVTFSRNIFSIFLAEQLLIRLDDLFFFGMDRDQGFAISKKLFESLRIVGQQVTFFGKVKSVV